MGLWKMWKEVFFKPILWIDILSTSCEIGLSIGSDNGLVPPGNKPLPEPVLT